MSYCIALLFSMLLEQQVPCRPMVSTPIEAINAYQGMAVSDLSVLAAVSETLKQIGVSSKLGNDKWARLCRKVGFVNSISVWDVPPDLGSRIAGCA